MRCLIVTFVGLLALLAMSHAQSDESENATVNSPESDEDSSSPAPPPPRPPIHRPRPGPIGPPGGLFEFGEGHHRQQSGQPGHGDANPRRGVFPRRIPVLFDFGSNNHFGKGNLFGGNGRRTTTTEASDYY